MQLCGQNIHMTSYRPALQKGVAVPMSGPPSRGSIKGVT